MKTRYRMFRRGNRFYVEDTDTGRQTSLETSNEAHAARLVAARNEAVEQPFLRLALARAYLSSHDPSLVQRKWRDVMEEFAERGKQQTCLIHKAMVGRRCVGLLRSS